jgi:hypothetical protein
VETEVLGKPHLVMRRVHVDADADLAVIVAEDV